MMRTICIHIQVEAERSSEAKRMGVAIMDHLEETFNDDESLYSMWVEEE